MNVTKLRKNILERWKNIQELDRGLMVSQAIEEMLHMYHSYNTINIYCDSDKKLEVEQNGSNSIILKVKE